jgi:hypothetical protein
VAHNSVLVYDPAEKFFWSDNLLPASNDGGQRMDSSRYWNTIRSPEDWNRTRDLWDLGSMLVVDHVPGQYHYALGDASNAYAREKLRRFTREILYLPRPGVLIVFDHVVSTNPSYRKAWLLHGVNQPAVDQDVGAGMQAAQDFCNATTFRFADGSGELLIHSLLPKERVVTRRGGKGNEFYTPGDDHGGAWGSGESWPLDPAEGGPLPADPKLRRMWKLFWGEDFNKLLSSNRKNVVPGNWRVEVSAALPAEEDFFLHVLEIGSRGKTGQKRTELLDGSHFQGAALEGGPIVLFSTVGSMVSSGEVSLPDSACESLIITSLQPNSVYELNFGGLNLSSSPKAVLPGVAAGTERSRANSKGILRLERRDLANLRLRLARL